ncbi:MAG: NFACT RNA binding domain-containing protein [bacterium]|nr:NFACT RNA binding domain-containing protein [bacterium]
MALDGIVINNLVSDLTNTLVGGRINKIAQPEKDELLLTIKNNREQYRLLISASASLPLMYLTNDNKQSPMTAPNFCMLLRKHLNSAKIMSITQPGLERIVNFEIEHLNELGDVCTKHLIVEIMGKHSNIIFCDDQKVIIDSIKHISSLVSRVREVLPGRPYFIPHTMDKLDPLTLTAEQFETVTLAKPMAVQKAIYSTLTGFSPVIAAELCHRASIDADVSTAALSENERLHLYTQLAHLIEDIHTKNYVPNIVYDKNTPVEFASVPLSCYNGLTEKKFDTISPVLETYYADKNTITRIKQKSVDLRKIITNALERNHKKYDLQLKQLSDTEKRDKYRIYGEMINTYGYGLEEGAKELCCLNYYTNEDIKIPLDPTLTPGENAKKYFDRYNKLKRTFEALTTQTAETKEEITHLDQIHTSLSFAQNEDDLVEIKEELMEFGYMKRRYLGKKAGKKLKITSKPFHYISSDGYHMYVGKNNYQNEELTFKFATGNDWWFHAKGIPGSHVVVKSEGDELPDRTFEEAGRLAAHYSKANDAEKVEIDYTQRKNVKKPSGGKPGFVVYYTNYSLMIEPDITGITKVE